MDHARAPPAAPLPRDVWVSRSQRSIPTTKCFQVPDTMPRPCEVGLFLNAGRSSLDKQSLTLGGVSRLLGAGTTCALPRLEGHTISGVHRRAAGKSRAPSALANQGMASPVVGTVALCVPRGLWGFHPVRRCGRAIISSVHSGEHQTSQATVMRRRQSQDDLGWWQIQGVKTTTTTV